MLCQEEKEVKGDVAKMYEHETFCCQQKGKKCMNICKKLFSYSLYDFFVLVYSVVI